VQLPNHTQIANLFIENMNKYSGAEVKIFCAISRKTIGWHKVTDIISYSQLKTYTGLSINSIKYALSRLIKDEWIVQTKTKNGYGYDLSVSKTDIVKPETMSIIDTVKSETISEIDTVKKPTVSKTDIVSPKTVSIIDTTKEITKENNNILFNAIKNAFHSKYGKFDNYPKEGKAIQELIKKAEMRGDPAEVMKRVLEIFWQLTENGNQFWKGQPFLPSTLNSSGIWSRVLKQTENKMKIIDPEINAEIERLFA